MGLVFLIIGYLIRFIAIFQGKGNLTQRLTIPRSLITTGLFKYIRHPFYLGTIIMLFGLGWLLGGIKIAFLLLPYSVGFFIERIYKEEEMMIVGFGNKYIEYMKKTKKIIPFIY